MGLGAGRSLWNVCRAERSAPEECQGPREGPLLPKAHGEGMRQQVGRSRRRKKRPKERLPQALYSSLIGTVQQRCRSGLSVPNRDFSPESKEILRREGRATAYFKKRRRDLSDTLDLKKYTWSDESALVGANTQVRSC